MDLVNGSNLRDGKLGSANVESFKEVFAKEISIPLIFPSAKHLPLSAK